MALKTGFAFLGALAPVGAIAAAYFGLGADWYLIALVAGAIALVSYIIAAVSAGSGFGEFMRGWLIGLNSALNAVLGFAVASKVGGAEIGWVVAGTLGAVNLLCLVAPVTQNGFFQGVVGWFNWVMPMSWPIVGLGIVLYMVSVLLYGVSLGKVQYLRVQDFGADWKTGTVFMKGGLVANLNYLDTAFNMGNFAFVDYKSGAWHMDHEAGHTLNLAAFGFVFHLIGALDENVIRGADAYAERLAESNSSGEGGSNIPMWA
jgi:hypothetical protein